MLLSPSAALSPGPQSLDRWFDNSTVANPRPDGTFAWAVLPPNAFRTLTVRIPDVRDPTAARWAFSVFKNMSFNGRMSAQFRGDVQRLQHTIDHKYGSETSGAETGATNLLLRPRRFC